MTDPFTLGQVFQVVGLAQKIANLFGLVQSVEAKIDKLLHADLGAGLRHLMAARDLNSEIEQTKQVGDARTCFQRAVVLEDGPRKAIALLGLACCQEWLGETTNSRNALQEILRIDPVTRGLIASAAGKKYLSYIGFPFISKDVKSDISDLFSGKSARQYKREFVLKAIEKNEDARLTRDIQLIVSEYLHQPVAWLEELK